jgi:hypothetical protein
MAMTKCSEDGCPNRVIPKAGRKKRKCQRCRDLAHLLERLHNEVPPELTADQERELRERRMRRAVYC